MKLFRATSLLETEGCESCKAALAAWTTCYVLDRIIHVQSSNLIFSTILWKNSHFSCLCLLKSSSAISFLQAICFAAKEENLWSLLSLKTEKNHILLLAYEELQEKEEAKKIPRDTVHSYWYDCQDCVEVSVPSWGCTVRCTPSRHRPGSASCAPAPPSPRPRSHCRTQARSAVFIRSFTHSLDGGSLTLPSLLPCMESNAVSKLINIFNRMLMRRKTKPIFSDMYLKGENWQFYGRNICN